jgi:hypothetical protein
MSSSEGTEPGVGQSKTDDEADAIRKGFAALPLDQKLATLLKIEFDLVAEGVEIVVNAASRVASEIADAVSGTTETAAPPPESGEASAS